MKQATSSPKYITPALPLLAVVFLVSACGTLDIAAVADTQFMMSTRTLPFERILVVCDTRDLGLKSELEEGMKRYLEETAGVEAFRDLDLFTPLKTLSEKEKVWALKDAGINVVLYMSAGGSGRSLRDWLYTEAEDVDKTTQAWQSSVVRLIIPETGQVVWAAGLPGESQLITSETPARKLYAAITSDLLKRGFLALPTDNQPLIRGFNR
ncbi:MAG: hypothetical protein M5R41_00465 [Bacteroidia bacterium]|nr:hypothetical protein [Bacteroidia bacterium]